ncbi:hypothetical protein B0H10DRAFT_2021327 [Mycena sp. CBHHK59/15]|nr:hypothetical protein B0H10DRAFT_2021327 [Mycena sp. CBHHK59/15]
MISIKMFMLLPHSSSRSPAMTPLANMSRTGVRVCIASLAVTSLVFWWTSAAFTDILSTTSILCRSPGTQSSPTNFDILAPTLYPSLNRTWITRNQETIHALFQCIEQGDCRQNQTKVIIIESYQFRLPLEGGWIGGEAIYAMSTVRGPLPTHHSTDLRTAECTSKHGIQRAFCVEYPARRPAVPDIPRPRQDGSHPWRPGEELLVRPGRRVLAHGKLSSRHPRVENLLVLFLGERGQSPGPEVDAESRRRESLLSFSVSFLSFQGRLSVGQYKSEGLSLNTYLGYSIEAQCALRPFIPHAERRSQVYVLAKFLHMFRPEDRAWAPELFDSAANATGVPFLAGTKPPSPADAPETADIAASITNVGIMKQDEFYDVLSHSLALVGIGNPRVSPTPYDALCLGVPFINPVMGWDRNSPDDRSKWDVQHGYLKNLSPPYVYHVFKNDREGFVQAIKDAIANPIQSYILERMKMSAVEYRLGQILEHDWRAEAGDLLEQGNASGSGPTFIL